MIKTVNYRILLWASATFFSLHLILHGELLLSDGFDDGQSDWCVVSPSGGSADFSANTAGLTVAGNGQPTAIWHSFSDLTISEGQWIQLAVRVRLASGNTTARDRDIRVALAYDNESPLTNDTTVLAIPYTGYFVTASANKSNVVARFNYVDGASTAKNFFNSSDGVINTSAGISSTVEPTGDWKILVLKFENVDGELQMSAKLDGESYGVYTIDDVGSGSPQEMFTFNALGLAYAYNIGERVNYETVSVKYGGSRTFDVNSYRLGSDPEDDWGVTIRRAVSNAQEYASLGTEHSSIVSFSNQVYVLAERTNIWAQIPLFEAERITLVGNGAELLCHPGSRPFALWESSDIEIENFQLDYSPLPMTQGSIIGVNRGYGFFDVDIDSGYCLPTLGLYPENWRADAVFTDSTGKYTHVWGRINNVYQPAGFPTNRVRLAFQSAFTNVINNINTGEKIALKIDFSPDDRTERDVQAADGDYKNAGNGNIEIRRCQDIMVSDIDSHAAPSFTSYIFGSEDVVFDDVNVLQEPGTDRILVSNKDGFHCKSCPVPPVIRNCYLERLADDAINVSDMADVIDEKFDADSFETHYSDNILSGSVLTDGQPVLIVDPDIPAKVGEAVVTNVVHVNYRRKQFDLIDITYESGWSSIASNCCFYIKREKPAEVDSCEFGTSLKTGLVSRGPLNARYNVFTDTAYGIHNFYEGGAAEGPYAYGLIAESNTFNSVTIGGIVNYVAGSGSFNVDMGIELRGNLVDQDDEGHGFKLTRINGADIEDNVFYFDSSVPASWEAIVLSDCADITESGNTGDRL